MIKRLAVSSGVLFLLPLVIGGAAGGGTPQIRDKEVRELLPSHISSAYRRITVGTRAIPIVSRDLDPEGRQQQERELAEERSLLEKLQELGLLSFDWATAMKGSAVSVSTTLTEKGKRVSVPSEDGPQVVGVPVAERELSRIVTIHRDNTVLFSFLYTPNDAGRAAAYKREKHIGKAKIIYDPDLDRFLFRGFLWRPWSGEKWEQGTWTYDKDGQTAVTSGIKE